MLDNDEPIPTAWPRNLHPAPDNYFHTQNRTDAAKLRAQALERYCRDPEAWTAKVREGKPGTQTT